MLRRLAEWLNSQITARLQEASETMEEGIKMMQEGNRMMTKSLEMRKEAVEILKEARAEREELDRKVALLVEYGILEPDWEENSERHLKLV